MRKCLDDSVDGSCTRTCRAVERYADAAILMAPSPVFQMPPVAGPAE